MMGQYGVKATEKGLRCRGYQFRPTPYVNRCERARCAACGFHYAEDPLDCLSYYSNFNEAEFWLVYGDGDGEMDEDRRDTKIACTEIEFLRRLDIFSYLVECLKYIHEHPRRPLNPRVEREIGHVIEGAVNRFVVVVGESPAAMGTCEGDVLCMMERRPDRPEEDMVAIFIVGKEGFLPGVYYDITGGIVDVHGIQERETRKDHIRRQEADRAAWVRADTLTRL